ncbi:helix-turn-helix domain-containing protein [uncultured Amnibacterium sp.]|uniref:helix-turn-helix domain-containing protein n=1 Tax=uncultured Amnibacterium sp. TaxID=1631851 RepID=UPI0035CBFBFC
MSAPSTPTRLGSFLRASRARLQPEDVGLPPHGSRRRVSGLRREELALLAGVSPSYYTRLEQGQSRNASAQVLEAIASALRLTASERAHLVTLAAADHFRSDPEPTTPETPDPALVQLLHALGDVPAMIMGSRTDVLAWNPAGHALLAGHLAFTAPDDVAARPNMAELVFLDAHTRDLYRMWRAKAEAVVGNLRIVAGAHPHDRLLATLIGSLIIESPDFAAMWSDNRIRPCAAASYALRHPLLGRLTLLQQTLRSVATPEQVLVTHTAAAGSEDAEALSLLAHYLADSRAPERSAGPRRPASVSI